MSNQEQAKHKPVWRVPNYDGHVPSDLGSSVLIDKEVMSSAFFLHGTQWLKLDFILDILAYQTSRTREAKYERVECEVCYGKKVLLIRRLNRETVNCIEMISGKVPDLPSPLNCVIESFEKCPHCNGKGHKMECVK